jgi:hypothetical protein
LALLSGLFPYADLGLLDRTHIRFFTRESIEALFEECGFEIETLDRNIVSLENSEVPFDHNAIPASMISAVTTEPDALTYQFIVTARPNVATEDEIARSRLSKITSRLHAFELDAIASKQEEASLRAQLAESAGALLALQEELHLVKAEFTQQLAAVESGKSTAEETVLCLQDALRVAKAERAESAGALLALQEELHSVKAEFTQQLAAAESGKGTAEEAVLCLQDALSTAEVERAESAETELSLREELHSVKAEFTQQLAAAESGKSTAEEAVLCVQDALGTAEAERADAVQQLESLQSDYKLQRDALLAELEHITVQRDAMRVGLRRQVIRHRTVDVEAMRVELASRVEAMRLEFDARVETMQLESDARVETMQLEFDTRVEAARLELDAQATLTDYWKNRYEGLRARLEANLRRFGIAQVIRVVPGPVRRFVNQRLLGPARSRA